MYCFNPFVYLLSVTLWQAPRLNWLKIATTGSLLMRLWSARWLAHQGWACSLCPARCWSWLQFGWVRMRWFLLHMFYPAEGWPSVALPAVEQGYRKARGSVPGLEAEARNWHILLLMHISAVFRSWRLDAVLLCVSLGTCAARVLLRGVCVCMCVRMHGWESMHVHMCMYTRKPEVRLCVVGYACC